ncbi:sulfatase [Arenibacter sp. 6A1]|uniref:sulfatase n=1 Tax=Arenibacter sp. 6A1 TaxID=2720391 RepID=UPI001446F0BA|nr:sulfatase [Arenibacter sp. 6A1]NKI27518.1 sulfatase [Arenibacter sp. 6A1]
MKKTIRIYTVILVLLLVFHSCKTNNKTIPQYSEKQNIILINIDDLGWRDLGFMGSDYFETPNIDALSKKGIVFTNGYAASANCAPSRASLMTGEWVQRHGIYTVGTSERGKSKDRKLVPTQNTETLSDEFFLLPQLLQKNGYTTIHAGKWHLTEDPLNSGFVINIGGSHAGHPKSYYPPYRNVDLLGEPGKRLTDLVMDKTLDYIKNTKGPFFLNYAPYAVHTPIQPVPELVEKYKNKSSSLGQDNADYATMIENLDSNLGRLVATLEETGKLKNTFIVFTSDNGGLFSVSKQHPLRSGKGSYYEGGIRVPFFFVWNNVISAMQRSDEPISNLDLYPTILEVAKVKAPKSKNLDGKNLVPLLTGEQQTFNRPLYWHFPVYLEAVALENENRDPKFRTRPGSVIRFGKWKLHHYFEDDAIELYNLEEDLGEKNNVAETHGAITKELLQLLINWRENTMAPVPSALNPDYKE